MSFNGLNFIFDGKSSEFFGLYLFNLNGRGSEEFSGGANFQIHTDKTPMSPKHSLLGINEEEPLKFKLSFGSLKPLSRYDISSIQKWLFGHKDYKELKIIQDDMMNVHYKCILNNPQIKTIGNMPYAFTCDVICDSSYAWESEKTYHYVTNGASKTIIHNNISDLFGYVYPKVEFTTLSSGGKVVFLNKSNGNMETTFEGLSANEKITLDGELQTIVSSKGLKRLGNFNKNWFELISGANQIEITGNIDKLSITYANAKRIGG